MAHNMVLRSNCFKKNYGFRLQLIPNRNTLCAAVSRFSNHLVASLYVTKTLGLEHNKVDNEIAFVRVGYKIATKPIVKLWNMNVFGWMVPCFFYLLALFTQMGVHNQHELGR